MKKKDRRKKRKFLEFFISGDDDLRKLVFNEPPISQQSVFELFARLDEIHYLFFLFYSTLPSKRGLWELLGTCLAAVASGTSKNRNFCENYNLLEHVREEKTEYGNVAQKYLDLTGVSHGFWYALSDPNYDEKPNTREIWNSFIELNASRMVWDWWFDSKCKEAEAIWNQYKNENYYIMEATFEHWVDVNFGLSKPRQYWYALFKMLLYTYEQATLIKHKLAKSYLRLAYSITKRVAARNQPNQFFDTFNIACAGLMRAISKYAPSMAMSFSNFAEKEITYEIYCEVGNYNLVHLPNKIWQAYRDYENYKADFVKKYNKVPSLNDLAECYDLDHDTVYRVYSQVGLQNPCSLDTKVYSEDESSRPMLLKDKLEDFQEKDQKKLLENTEFILISLQRMPLRQRKLFGLTHNLCDILQEIEPDTSELHNFFYAGGFLTAIPGIKPKS